MKSVMKSTVVLLLALLGTAFCAEEGDWRKSDKFIAKMTMDGNADGSAIILDDKENDVRVIRGYKENACIIVPITQPKDGETETAGEFDVENINIDLRNPEEVTDIQLNEEATELCEGLTLLRAKVTSDTISHNKRRLQRRWWGKVWDGTKKAINLITEWAG